LDNGYVARDWARYWRSADLPIEAMYAHFEQHVYHRHSHETYSFGVTEQGAQTFSCRGTTHVSGAGMVMAFNPDDPHDGHATDELGFTYRMLHISSEQVLDTLSDRAGHRVAAPLFAEPVVRNDHLARALRALHLGLIDGSSSLRRGELLTRAITASTFCGATRTPATAPDPGHRDAVRIAQLVRDVLHTSYAEDVHPADIAALAGRSRFAVYRAFRETYGLAPSDYQRQLRLRAARTLLMDGKAISDAAIQVGFADQSHLNRWFRRSFGITPGAYRKAALALPGELTSRVQRGA
jgi:AraC-like DNA-binding protein